MWEPILFPDLLYRLLLASPVKENQTIQGEFDDKDEANLNLYINKVTYGMLLFALESQLQVGQNCNTVTECPALLTTDNAASESESLFIALFCHR